MTSEHIKMNIREAINSKKNILESQLCTIKMIKTIQAYKQYRDEELVLKIALKEKVDNLKALVANFDKTLPKTTFFNEEEVTRENPVSSVHRKTLDEEIGMIRQKIEALKNY